jgi:hypothetical protein
MRSLALAKYRFLVSIRATGLAIGGLAAAIISVLLGSIGVLSTADIASSDFPRLAPEAFAMAAKWVTSAYLFHTVALLALCFGFGTAQRRSDQPSADLMQTAPVSAAQTFWGDCLGVLAATLSIHAAAVPLLAVILALSPHPTSTFWIFETAVVLVLFLASALAAWSLRAESWRWSIARSFRASVVVLIILAGAAGLFARRPAGLADALIAVMDNPGRRSLVGVVTAFRNPPTATLVFAILYAAFVAFFFIHSVRRALRE